MSGIMGTCGSSSRELGVFEVRGESFGWRKTPPPSFFICRCRGARPGELTCFLFLGEEISKAFYRSAFAYSNPSGQISNIYFKDTTVITVNLKDTRLPCSGAFHLSRARQGTTTHRS